MEEKSLGISNLGLSVGQEQNRTLPLIHRFAVPLPPREGLRLIPHFLCNKAKSIVWYRKSAVSPLSLPLGEGGTRKRRVTDEGKGAVLILLYR